MLTKITTRVKYGFGLKSEQVISTKIVNVVEVFDTMVKTSCGKTLIGKANTWVSLNYREECFMSPIHTKQHLPSPKQHVLRIGKKY